MSALLLLTDALSASTEVLPALEFLGHQVRVAPLEASALVSPERGFGAVEVVLVDARRELAAARSVCRLLTTTGTAAPVVAVVTEGSLPAIGVEWDVDDLLLATAGPAEVQARLRLAIGRSAAEAGGQDDPGERVVRRGDLTVDAATYSCRLRNRPLDLTYIEFQLLAFLAEHPGRVFTRAQLLQEVWGYDYYGGTRTVDVHVRRLRAKLGSEHESLIGTVRNVGYKFVSPARTAPPEDWEARPAPTPRVEA